MPQITETELLNTRFMDDDGNVLDPLTNPHVLMPHPQAHPNSGPCLICLVIGDGQPGYHPTELQMASFEEAEPACDAANARMGWTPQDVERVIVTSMGGGLA